MGWLAIFRSRRMAVIFALGFSSGLPLYLTGQTLSAWLTSANIPLERLTTFSLVGLAYTTKFMWAPLVDLIALPLLGRRRGWMLASQIGLAISIVAMGQLDPNTQPGALFGLAVAVAVCSATQDVVIDAYQVDLLREDERAAGAALYVVGYRVALLVTGTFALVLADHVSWNVIYSAIASLMVIGIVATMFAEEPALPPDRPRGPLATLIRVFVDFFRRLGWRGAIAALAFVALYKFGDSFVQTLLIPFFRRGLGYSWTEIATIYKLMAFIGMFTGGLAAGALVARYGLRRTLLVFGVLQASTNLIYAALAANGPSYPLFASGVLLDNLAGALGTAAFVAYMMSVCNPSVSATQYALLTSLSSIGQRVFGPLADDFVVRLDPHGIGELAANSGTVHQLVVPHAEQAAIGLDWGRLSDIGELAAKLDRALIPRGDLVIIDDQWPAFFIATTVMAIPGLIAVWAVTRRPPSARA